MGKGDRRTRRGKIFRHSYGKYRMKLNKLLKKKNKKQQAGEESGS